MKVNLSKILENLKFPKIQSLEKFGNQFEKDQSFKEIEKEIEQIASDMKNKTNSADMKISKLCFLEYFDIPLIFLERIYFLLFGSDDKITTNKFVSEISSLFKRDLMKFSFDLYDFGKKGKIEFCDVKIILQNIYVFKEQFPNHSDFFPQVSKSFIRLLEIKSKLPGYFKDLIEGKSSTSTQNSTYTYIGIYNPFASNSGVDYNRYKSIISTVNSDLFLIVLYYLGKILFSMEYSSVTTDNGPLSKPKEEIKNNYQFLLQSQNKGRNSNRNFTYTKYLTNNFPNNNLSSNIRNESFEQVSLQTKENLNKQSDNIKNLILIATTTIITISNNELYFTSKKNMTIDCDKENQENKNKTYFSNNNESNKKICISNENSLYKNDEIYSTSLKVSKIKTIQFSSFKNQSNSSKFINTLNPSTNQTFFKNQILPKANVKSNSPYKSQISSLNKEFESSQKGNINNPQVNLSNSPKVYSPINSKVQDSSKINTIPMIISKSDKKNPRVINSPKISKTNYDTKVKILNIKNNSNSPQNLNYNQNMINSPKKDEQISKPDTGNSPKGDEQEKLMRNNKVIQPSQKIITVKNSIIPTRIINSNINNKGENNSSNYFNQSDKIQKEQKIESKYSVSPSLRKDVKNGIAGIQTKDLTKYNKKATINLNIEEDKVKTVTHKDVQNLIENFKNNDRYNNICKKNKGKLKPNEMSEQTIEQTDSFKSLNEKDQNITLKSIGQIKSEPNILNPIANNISNNSNEKTKYSLFDGTLSLLCEISNNIFIFNAKLYRNCIKMFTSKGKEFVINLNNCFIKDEGLVTIDNSTHNCFSLFHNYSKQYFLYSKEENWLEKLLDIFSQIQSPLTIKDFTIESFLGQGKFSTVHKAKISEDKLNSSCKSYSNLNNYDSQDSTIAIKVIKKTQMDKMDLISTRKEINILKIVNHPNIIKHIDMIENYKNIYILIEYVPSITLYEFFKQKNYDINESVAKYIVIKLLKVVDYLQENCIVHRDLKPENILIKEISKGKNVQKNIQITENNVITKKLERNRSPNNAINFNSSNSGHLSNTTNNSNNLGSGQGTSSAGNIFSVKGQQAATSTSYNYSYKAEIKVIDFGLARFLGKDELIINEPYGTLVDFLYRLMQLQK